MNISPVSFNFLSSKNRVSNSNKNLCSSDRLFNLSKDTVSFGSCQNIVQRAFDEINESVNNEIMPVVAESKDLYISVGKIGYNAQEILKYFGKEENDYFRYKLGLWDESKNPYYLKYRRFLDAIKDYKDNEREFKRLQDMASRPLYNKSDILEVINSSKSLYEKESPLCPILPIFDAYELAKSSALNKIDDIFLANKDERLTAYYKTLREQYSCASYYMMISPFGQSQKLIKDKENFEKEINNPKVSILDKMRKIDSFNHSIASIKDLLPIYADNKSDMQKFVENNQNITTFSIDNITFAYLNMKKECSDIFDNAFEKFDSYVQDNYSDVDLIVDWDEIHKSLKCQKIVNMKIQKLVNQIKQDYIANQYSHDNL